MASCRSAASQNATPTRSKTGSLSKLTGGGLVGFPSLSISGFVTITSGPSKTCKFSLATKGLSIDNKNPRRVKVQGSLLLLRRFFSAFDKCCLLCWRSRGKPRDEGYADWNKKEKQKTAKKKHWKQLMFDVASYLNLQVSTASWPMFCLFCKPTHNMNINYIPLTMQLWFFSNLQRSSLNCHISAVTWSVWHSKIPPL